MKDTMHLRSIFAAVAIAALMVFGMVAAAGLAPSARTGLAFDPHPFTGPTIYNYAVNSASAANVVTATLTVNSVGDLIVVGCGIAGVQGGSDSLGVSDGVSTFSLSSGPAAASGAANPVDIFTATALAGSVGADLVTCTATGFPANDMAIVAEDTPSGTPAGENYCNLVANSTSLCYVTSTSTGALDLGFTMVNRPTGGYTGDPWTFVTGSQTAVLGTSTLMNADYNMTGSPGGSLPDVWEFHSSSALTGTMTVLSINPGPPPLVASFTPSTIETAYGVNVGFTDTTTGGVPAYTYAWTFGDGGTATTANPGHTYATSGVFEVKETVTDSALSVSAAYNNITVVGGVVITTQVYNGSHPVGGGTCTTASNISLTCDLNFTASVSFGVAPFTYNVTLLKNGVSVYSSGPTSAATTADINTSSVWAALNGGFAVGHYRLWLNITDSSPTTVANYIDFTVALGGGGGGGGGGGIVGASLLLVVSTVMGAALLIVALGIGAGSVRRNHE